MVAAIVAFVLSVAAGLALAGAPALAVIASSSIMGAFIIYYLDKLSKK